MALEESLVSSEILRLLGCKGHALRLLRAVDRSVPQLPIHYVVAMKYFWERSSEIIFP